MEDRDRARQELQRADHLLYITIKYTRTGEVMKNTIGRLISALDCAALELLEYLKDKKKIKEIDTAPILRFEALAHIFPKDKAIKDYVNFYFLLRKLHRLDYKMREEYRKNITMTVDYIEVNANMLKRYYLKTKEFVEFVNQYRVGKG